MLNHFSATSPRASPIGYLWHQLKAQHFNAPKIHTQQSWAANNKDRWSRNILSFWTSTARRILHIHWRCYSHSSQATHCHLQFAEQTVFTPFHLTSVTVGNSLRKALCTKQTQDGCDSCQHRIKSWRKATAAESWRSSSFPDQGRGECPTQAEDLKIPQTHVKKKQQRLKSDQKGELIKTSRINFFFSSFNC